MGDGPESVSDDDRSVWVFGPAYLDRVVLTGGPLAPGAAGAPLDASVEGAWEAGEGLSLRDPSGAELAIDPPPDWPGPSGLVRLRTPLVDGLAAWRRSVRAVSWHDDLGGMGAGFAAALGGRLVSALGPEDDPIGRAIVARLAAEGVTHHLIRINNRPSDWTLLITSGRHGDKLPVGFRGCHAALETLDPWARVRCELQVVAGLPNPLAAAVLRERSAPIRLFAPAMRNVRDREFPVASFADAIEVLSCNRREWESLSDQNTVLGRVPVVAVTDGPNGCRLRFHSRRSVLGEWTLPVFPRRDPPRDTNRAGEAFAAELVRALRAGGWAGGPADPDLVRNAGVRASVSAALVLDRPLFGFPAPAEIERALAAGHVGDGGP